MSCRMYSCMATIDNTNAVFKDTIMTGRPEKSIRRVGG